MDVRFDYTEAAPSVYRAMEGLESYLLKCRLERKLQFLVQLRASQINGCAYCIDMHWKDLIAAGEDPQRLYSLDAWQECPYYTARERAALAWTEGVTRITSGRVPDGLYEEVRPHFNEGELADLTLAIAAINAWNRLSISARLAPGGYTAAETVPAEAVAKDR